MSKARVVIVEDEMIIARQMEEQLTRLDYKIVGIASSGKQALEIVEIQQPDIVLMDIVIKGELDGIETADLIYRLHNIPVIYVSAFTDDTIISRAKSTGSYGFIVKPFTNEELRLTIEIACYKHQTEEKMKKIQEWYSTHDSLTGLYNIRSLREIFDVELEKAKIQSINLNLALLDIDNFKEINKQHGRLAGNKFLEKFGLFLKNHFKDSEILGHFGEDKFLVILPYGNKENSEKVVEILRKKFKETSDLPFSKDSNFSFSLASFPEDGDNFETLIYVLSEKLQQVKKMRTLASKV